MQSERTRTLDELMAALETAAADYVVIHPSFSGCVTETKSSVIRLINEVDCNIVVCHKS